MQPEPQPDKVKKQYRKLSDLVKEAPKFRPASEVQEPVRQPTKVVEAPRLKIPEGADPRAYRSMYSLNDDDCPYLGASFTGTWTCSCVKVVYREGKPLFPDLKCFEPGHTGCEEYRSNVVYGLRGYRSFRRPFSMG